jgi:hypothetical protein
MYTRLFLCFCCTVWSQDDRVATLCLELLSKAKENLEFVAQYVCFSIHSQSEFQNEYIVLQNPLPLFSSSVNYRAMSSSNLIAAEILTRLTISRLFQVRAAAPDR